jgi:5,5'-dehydrodivanillate O-demethylase
MDNSLDPVHFEHLHGHYGNYYNKKAGLDRAMNPAPHKKIEFDVFDYGIYKRRLLEGDDEANPPDDWTTGHPILFPNTLVQGTGDAFSYQIRIPIDDTHTMHTVYFGRPYKEGEAPQEVVPVTRSEVQYDHFGLVVGSGILQQDEMVWTGQGPISDRTVEHLATSDKGIILYHNMLLENVAKVERGEDPMAVLRDASKNEPWLEVKRETVGYQAFRINRDVVGGRR